jgi:hypothetical protein
MGAPEFVYKQRIRACIKEVEQLKNTRAYEEFVCKANESIDKWNRILAYKTKKIGKSFTTWEK